MTQTKLQATKPNIPIDPLFMMWSLPFIMTQTWIAACLGATCNKDILKRNGDAGTDTGAANIAG